MFLRAVLSTLLTLFLAASLQAANPPLHFSLRFPDLAYASISGAEAVVLNPAALYVNQAPSAMVLHSFGKNEFSGDNGFLVTGSGLGFGYQKLTLGRHDAISRYDFAASSKIIRNVYTGLSYVYYKTDFKTLDKAHAWNYSLLYHAHRAISLGFQARNVNKQVFAGEKTAVEYVLSTAVRPAGEILTVGCNAGMYSGQKLSSIDWNLSARASLRKGLALYAAIDNLGSFGAGLEFHFGHASSGGESFFDNDAKYTGSTIYGGLTAATREQLISHVHSVLHVDFSGEIPEEYIKPFLWGKSPQTVYQKLARIQAAKTDPQIRGLLVTVRNPAIGWARLGDFRKAIKDFRSSGKPVVAYLGTSAGNGSYYLASAANKVYMLPVDALYLTGLRAQVTFYKGAMDKLGIEAEIERSGKYKSFSEVFTDTTLSPEFREAIEVVLDDLYDQIIAETAADRGMSAAALKELVDSGPFTSTQAESLKLVNGRFYSHELEGKMPELFGDYYGITSESAYRADPSFRERFCEPPVIALIAIEGGIVKGGSGFDYLDGSTVGSSTVVSAIKAARSDASVRAIVMRINSPGGDAIASDLIWAELSEARKTKPVIVSMSDVCASGGYYIASASDQIFLQPTTVTGSIGVFAGKANLAALYSKLGLRTETITRGKHANMFSMTEPLSDEERSILRRHVMDMNTRFVSIVADGRLLPVDSVHAIAQGRTWSGRRALELGLADTQGSLLDAVELARQKANILDNDYVVVEMPKRRLVPRLTNLALSSLARTFGWEGSGALSALRSLGATSLETGLQMRMPYNLVIE